MKIWVTLFLKQHHGKTPQIFREDITIIRHSPVAMLCGAFRRISPKERVVSSHTRSFQAPGERWQIVPVSINTWDSMETWDFMGKPENQNMKNGRPPQRNFPLPFFKKMEIGMDWNHERLRRTFQAIVIYCSPTGDPTVFSTWTNSPVASIIGSRFLRISSPCTCLCDQPGGGSGSKPKVGASPDLATGLEIACRKANLSWRSYSLLIANKQSAVGHQAICIHPLNIEYLIGFIMRRLGLAQDEGRPWNELFV